MLRNEQAQRDTDYWRGVADEHESLRRFVHPLPAAKTKPTLSTPFAKPTTFSDLLAQWNERDSVKRQLEEEETRSFNLRHGYTL